MMEIQEFTSTAAVASQTDALTVIRSDGTADPKTDPRVDKKRVIDMYKAMVRTRIIDEQLIKLQRQGRIGFHIGPLGEEAAVIASAAAARDQDWLFPCYREFGALLWRGMPLQEYVDNMFGNADDPALGRQMPDHYTGKPYKFGSVSSPIGTQITQAMGFAWAAKIKGDDLVTLVYMGEGATSSNDFHTGLNFAGVFKTPTVFLVRNNRWAISVPSHRQTASKTFAEKGIAYGIRGVRCDGNDVLATYSVVQEAVRDAASGKGPTLVEMLTYRLGGHSTSDDPRAYRSETEVDEWKQRDPILRLRAYLDGHSAWSDAQDAQWRSEVEAELKACVALAEKKPRPPLASLFSDVFSDLPWHLREQLAELERGPRAPAPH
jgi:2-oxoisovalerate dehydrogenase E1 component alpha subunit